MSETRGVGVSASHCTLCNRYSGSNFQRNAMGFGMGAMGGVAAFSLMSSMSHSYRDRPGYYEPGYGCK